MTEQLPALAAVELVPGQVELGERLPHQVGVHLLQLQVGQLVACRPERVTELLLPLGEGVELPLPDGVVQHVALDEHRQQGLALPFDLLLLRLQRLDLVPDRRQQLGVQLVRPLDGDVQDRGVSDRLADGLERGVVNGLRPDPLDVTAVLPRLLVTDALVVVVPAVPPLRARRGHRVAALAADQVRERERIPSVRLRGGLLLDVGVHDLLDLLEGLLVDDGLVLADEALVVLSDEAHVELRAQQRPQVGRDPLLAPSHLAVGDLHPLLLPVAVLVQPVHQLHRRAQLQVLGEDQPNLGSLVLVHGEAARARVVVAEHRRSPTPESTLGPGAHGDAGALGRLLPLELGEHEHQLQHGPADGRGRVELLPERAELHVLGLEQLVDLEEVQQAAGQPIDPGHDDQVDVPLPDALEHALECGPVEVLAARALLPEDLDDLVGSLAGVDVGADAGFLGVQAALVLLGLEIGAHARVDRDAHGFRLGHGAPWRMVGDELDVIPSGSSTRW